MLILSASKRVPSTIFLVLRDSRENARSATSLEYFSSMSRASRADYERRKSAEEDGDEQDKHTVGRMYWSLSRAYRESKGRNGSGLTWSLASAPFKPMFNASRYASRYSGPSMIRVEGLTRAGGALERVSGVLSAGSGTDCLGVELEGVLTAFLLASLGA
jgi:hypothetical protein